MDVEVPVLSGYMTIAQQSGSIKTISKKKSPKFCLLFTSSRHGIERLEIGESETDKNPKIITLESCVKITQENPPANLIHIVMKTGSLTLNAPTEEDLKRWLTALQNVAFKEKAIADGSVGSAANLSRSNSAIEEDNDLYCSSYGDGIFVINLIATDTSVRCNIPAKMYKLSLAPTELQLVDFDDEKKVIAKWPYRFIRKYGYRDGHFTFEAGRKCDTGEGNFSLEHVNPQDIFRSMSTKMKSMKKMLNENLTTPTDENQLSVAVSMEAGSRSPIPLFLNALHTGPDANTATAFDINSYSSTSSSSQMQHNFALVRGFLSSTDSLNNVSTTSSSIPLLKHIPNKPPRKTALPDPKASALSNTISHINSNTTSSCSSNNNNNNNANKYEELPELPKRNQILPRDYECIETITDAWKTMGIDEVKHTENVNANNEVDLIDFSVRSGKKELLLLDGKIRTAGRKLVEFPTDPNRDPLLDDDNYNRVPETLTSAGEVANGEGNYDRLEYFRTHTRPSSSTYKTVIPITVATSANISNNSSISNNNANNMTMVGSGVSKVHVPPANDDYEIIGNPDTNTCRLADDSYLGYGVLRKPAPTPTTTTTTTTTHIQSPSSATPNKTFLMAAAAAAAAADAAKDEVLLKNSAILLTDPSSPVAVAAATSADGSGASFCSIFDADQDVDDVLGHHKYNGLDYAIVSKPKRV